jgi:hypothetical protein
MWTALVAMSACGDDPSETDGFETGSCIAGECLGGLACVDDMCVQPEDATTTTPMGDTGTLPPGSSTTNPVATTDVADSSTSSPADSSTGDPVATSTMGSSSDGGPACPTVMDDVCDEPEGTGTCPEGTDVEDCAPPVCGGVPPVVPVACDQWVQNCPEGDKCMPYAAGGGTNWDSLGCFPIDCSTAGIGQACQVVDSGTSGIDNCEAGAMCWSVDTDTNEGYCVAMCEGSPVAPTCSDPATTCAIANNGTISLCLPECDPLAPACVANESCAPINDLFACAPDASGDQGAYGDPCLFINACDPGNACIGPDAFSNCLSGVGCCTVFCDASDVASDAMCAALDPAQTCVEWFTPGMAPLGLEDVGVCSIAP